MMWLDIFALVILIGFAFAGSAVGGTRQLLRLGAAIAAVLCAPFGARLLAGPIAASFPGLPLVAITGLSLILAAIAIYLVLALISRLITDVIIKASTILTIVDHTIGLALGIITAAILLFIVGHGILSMRASLPGWDLDHSRYLALVQQVPVHDLLNLAHIQTHLL